MILIALSLSIAAVFVVYEKGQWTFDKLKPIHASHALNAMDAIDKQVDALSKKDEQEALRIRSIRAAQLELAKIKANKPTTVNDINAYDDWLFLQVVRDNELPQKLGMFDRGLIVLNVVQMITILFVFALIVVLAGLCYFDGDAIADAGGEVVVWLHRSSQASLIALVLAALFAFFYLLLNKHIEPFVGKGGVTLFNYIVPILCLVFVWILVRYGLQYRTLDTTNWWEATKAAIPMLGALASVSVIAFLMEKFIGRDVSSSTRLLGNILIVALCLFSVKDTVIEFASSAK